MSTNLHHSIEFRFMRPLVNGDYPDTKLPKFSRNQYRELVGAFDFIGVNYYSTLAAKDNPSHVPQDQRDFLNDSFAKLSGETICFPSALLCNSIRNLQCKLYQNRVDAIMRSCICIKKIVYQG